MKLYELKRGQKFKILYEGEELEEVLTFEKTDGSYSSCFDSSGQIAYITVYAEVILLKD